MPLDQLGVVDLGLNTPIPTAMIAGERDPKKLADLARPLRMRPQDGLLEEAFAGLKVGTSASITGSC